MPFFMLKSRSQYLYHYTSLKPLLEKILPSRHLRMSPIVETNDPRETKDWIFGFRTSSDFDGISDPEYFAMVKDATQIAKSKCKVICFTRDCENATGFTIDGIYDRGFCKPRMWAQYGDKHSGVCLTFDWEKLRAAIRSSVQRGAMLFESDVHYVNRPRAPSATSDNPFLIDFDFVRRAGLQATVQHHVKRFWRELFFEKLRDWADEKEYRWVLWEDSNEHLFDFNDSLVGILLGANFPPANLVDLQPYLRQYEIQISSLNWKNGVPEVLPAPILAL
jgi:Protein of unknown function (DUF2971)